MRKFLFYNIIAWMMASIPVFTYSQDKDAKITLSFDVVDSVKTCKALVTSGDAPVKEVEVKLYVKRLFSLLPIGGAVATDEEGIASFEFPNDIPADMDGKLTVIAKTEDDENVGTIEASATSDWGIPRGGNEILERSLSGSRSKAPWIFIIASNVIIIGIWGTLIYVISQLFRIKKLSKHLAKK